jgi:DNA-binding NarL/FixJ family response regulator
VALSGGGIARFLRPSESAVDSRSAATRDDSTRGLAMLIDGACGYLLKKTLPARLLEAIREANGGGAPMSPEIARKVVSLFQKTGPPITVDAHLTPQELRLLRLLAEGHSYRAAADHLAISIDTIRNYIRSVYQKLHVHSRSEAVTKTLRARLIH